MELNTEKNFTIVDSPEMCTLAFAVNKPEEGTSYCTLQKLNYTLEDSTNVGKKTFYLENSDNDQDDIVLLTLDGEKAFLNAAILSGDKLLVSEKPAKIDFEILNTENSESYKELKYTPNFRRPISIIDPEIADEVRPVLYYDEDANMVKAKIKLQPNKSYIALEVKEV